MSSHSKYLPGTPEGKKTEVREDFKGAVTKITMGTKGKMPTVELQSGDRTVEINLDPMTTSMIDKGMTMEGTLVTDEAGRHTMEKWQTSWPEPEWR